MVAERAIIATGILREPFTRNIACAIESGSSLTKRRVICVVAEDVYNATRDLMILLPSSITILSSESLLFPKRFAMSKEFTKENSSLGEKEEKSSAGGSCCPQTGKRPTILIASV